MEKGGKGGSIWGRGLLAELIHKKTLCSKRVGRLVEKVKGWSCGWFQEALVGVGRRFCLIPFPATHPPADFSPGVASNVGEATLK